MSESSEAKVNIFQRLGEGLVVVASHRLLLYSLLVYLIAMIVMSFSALSNVHFFFTLWGIPIFIAWYSYQMGGAFFHPGFLPWKQQHDHAFRFLGRVKFLVTIIIAWLVPAALILIFFALGMQLKPGDPVVRIYLVYSGLIGFQSLAFGCLFPGRRWLWLLPLLLIGGTFYWVDHVVSRLFLEPEIQLRLITIHWMFGLLVLLLAFKRHRI
jgi:hypothetical protein